MLRARTTRRGVILFECLFILAMMTGAAGGMLWGWWNYGWVGAVVGIPVGAVLGWAALAAVFLAVLAILWVWMTLGVLWAEGPREAWRFFRHGERWAGQSNPPTAEEAERTR